MIRNGRVSSHPVVINLIEHFLRLPFRPDVGKTDEAVVTHALEPSQPLPLFDPLVVVGVTPGTAAVCQSQPQVRYRIVHEEPHHQSRNTPILAKASNMAA